MEKRYYWLRLKDDFFKSKYMKKLRKIAGGDTYTIIYLKMMLRSLTTGGVLVYEGIEDSFSEELALDLDEDPDNVQIAITYLSRFNLIVEVGDGEYELPEAKNCIGSENASAQRVRDHRARQKALQSNTTVTDCNAIETDVKRECCVEIEKEKEKDIDIEIEKRGEFERGEKTPYQLIADMFNDTCVSFPRITTLSNARKKAIKARYKQYSLDDFKRLFEKAEASDFLKGSNSRNWSANFDWMIKDTNMAKILDGNYDKGRGDGYGRGGGTSGSAAESEEVRQRREWALARAEAKAEATRLSQSGQLQGLDL